MIITTTCSATSDDKGEDNYRFSVELMSCFSKLALIALVIVHILASGLINKFNTKSFFKGKLGAEPL